MGYNQFRYARRIDANVIGIYTNQLAEMLRIDRSTADRTKVEGKAIAGYSLALVSNRINGLPSITLVGGNDAYYDVPNTKGHIFQEGSIAFLKMYEDGTDEIIEGQNTNNDLFLKPNGSGVVKFGTKTGTGDVAVDGYVSIKSGAGAVVKLATVA